MKSKENWTRKPYLVPVNTFFGGLDSGLMMEFPLGELCLCISSSACGIYIAAEAGGDIVVVKAGSGEVLRRMRVHSNDATLVTFDAGGR